DTQYTAGAGLTLTGTEFILDIPANSISQGDIGNNAIGPGEIQSDAVSSDEIDDESIVNIDIAAGAAIDGSKINPDFGGQTIITTGGLSVGADILLNGNNVIPDYVFQKYFSGQSKISDDYQFMSLKNIEAFVKSNNHLPGIKSATQVEEDGYWNLSKSNIKNLEKIEELFLHTIEQEKKIDQLKAENETLSKELKAIKADMELIKAMLSQQQKSK
ncbi:bZIP transcription factor, partial [Croceitalea sp. F388]